MHVVRNVRRVRSALALCGARLVRRVCGALAPLNGGRALCALCVAAVSRFVSFTTNDLADCADCAALSVCAICLHVAPILSSLVCGALLAWAGAALRYPAFRRCRAVGAALSHGLWCWCGGSLAGVVRLVCWWDAAFALLGAASLG